MGDVAFHSDKKSDPELLREKMEKTIRRLSKEPRRFVAFPHTVFYPPWAIFPQAIAIFLGRPRARRTGRADVFVEAGRSDVSVGLGYTALRVMRFFAGLAW